MKQPVTMETTGEKLAFLISKIQFFDLENSDLAGLAKCIKKGESSGVFKVLHELVSQNREYRIVKSALFAIRYLIKKLELDFFTEKIVRFYVKLLITTIGDCCRFTADIVAVLYKDLEYAKQIVGQEKINDFILYSEDIEPYSALILQLVKSKPEISGKAATFIALRVSDLLLKSDDAKRDALGTLEVLMGKVDKHIFEDKIETIITQVYSEEPNRIRCALRILTYLGIPFTDLNMIFTFIQSRDITIAEPAADMLARFASFFDTQSHQIVTYLLQSISDVPYAIAVCCLHAAYYFERSEEQTEKLASLLIEFAEGDEGSDLCLACAKALIEKHPTERMLGIIDEHSLILDNLFFSETESVSKLAQQLIELRR